MKSFRTAHLPVGDIWIGLDISGNPAANGIIIERKSAADLEASILDGRYREQRARLLSFAQERKAHPAYIIEGDLAAERSRFRRAEGSSALAEEPLDRLQARLKKPALMKHLTRLALRYHVAVFQTACINETAELCELLVDQWGSDPTTFETPATLSYVETRGVTRESNTDDPKVFAVTVLSSCRGISAAGAKAILDGCGGNLENVWKASAVDIAAIQVGKQKIGKVKAERLYGLLHGN